MMERRRVQIMDTGKPVTKQEFEPDCNIRTIMRRARLKNIDISTLKTQKGQFGDFTRKMGITEMLAAVKQARDNFQFLPIDVKKRFGHQPDELVKYLADPKNLEESYKLGLREQPKKEPTEDERIAAVAKLIKAADKLSSDSSKDSKQA